MKRIAVAMVAALLAMGAVAGAEEGPRVSGAGSEKFETIPDAMKVTVRGEAKGATVEEAIAAWKAKAESIKATLVEAGADAATVEISDPRLSGTGTSRNEMMMRRMMQMQAQKEGGDKKEAQEEPVKLEMTVTAAWKLSATDVEGLLVETVPLMRKVAKLDFTDKKAATPEELEEMEEAASSEDYYDEYGRPDPSKPSFLFTKQVDAAKVTEMQKTAFDKARTDASKKAALAGRTLAGIVTVDASVSRPDMDEDEMMQYAYMRSMLGAAAGGMQKQDDEALATAITPGKVSITVNVTATFGVE